MPVLAKFASTKSLLHVAFTVTLSHFASDTLTCFVAVDEHPPVTVTVNVYVVVVAGETVIEAVVAPVLQLYVYPDPPLTVGVNVVEVPTQISVVPPIETVGLVHVAPHPVIVELNG